MSNAAPRTQADLIQLFEPVREDLEAVEREFARQVQSQIHVIPEIGNYLLKSGGKRNEPAYVARVIEQLAAVRNVSAEAIGEQTDHNFELLFRP